MNNYIYSACVCVFVHACMFLDDCNRGDSPRTTFDTFQVSQIFRFHFIFQANTAAFNGKVGVCMAFANNMFLR